MLTISSVLDLEEVDENEVIAFTYNNSLSIAVMDEEEVEREYSAEIESEMTDAKSKGGRYMQVDEIPYDD